MEVEFDILQAITELKELTEQNGCNFDDDTKDLINDIYTTLDDMYRDIESTDKAVEEIEGYVTDIRDTVDNINHLAQYSFGIGLVIIGAVVLIKTFFTGW